MARPPDPEQLRTLARTLLIAAVTVELAAIAALLLPLASGGEVTDMLPLALLLFVVSSGLIVVSLGTRKKADGAAPPEA